MYLIVYDTAVVILYAENKWVFTAYKRLYSVSRVLHRASIVSYVW